MFPLKYIFLAFNFSRKLLVSKFDVRHKSNLLNIFSAVFGNFPFLKRFQVNLAFIRANGILRSLASKIKFGQISESTKNIFGLHVLRNFSIKILHHKEKIYVTLSNFLSSTSAILLELNVFVVIKNSTLTLFFKYIFYYWNYAF